MKATTCNSSIKRWQTILDAAQVPYYSTPTGKELIVSGPNGIKIQINHNGEYHWTIRIPGTAKDGMRFGFNVDINVDANAKLIVINDILAIRYL
jgi:hypothetical protein